MSEEQIKQMVDRFLCWRLPTNFAPDGGVTFKAAFNEHTAHPGKHEPTGTNLLDATQAEAMVRHMVEGPPLRSRAPYPRTASQKSAPDERLLIDAARAYREAVAAAHQAAMTRIIGDEKTTAHAFALADGEREAGVALLKTALATGGGDGR